MRTWIHIILAVTVFALFTPTQAPAQMREFDQNMAKLKIKLPPNIFNGTALNISTYAELQQINQFGVNYHGFLQKAIKAWNQLGRGQNTARQQALQAHQQYFDALLKAYLVKEKEIPPPAKPKPVKRRTVSLDQIYIGPDVKKDTPILIDTIGQYDTFVQAYGHPGTKAKPTRWSARLRFYVKYANFAHDDTVMIDVRKDGKSLGEPTACQAHRSDVPQKAHLAFFKCDAPNGREYDKLFSTSGVHTIALTYRKLIEGLEFKDFATLTVDVRAAKQGAANDPALKWQTNYDMKLPVSTIEEFVPHETPQDGGIKTAIDFAFQTTEHSMTVRTWFKADKGYHPTKLTCVYSGKRIAEAEGHKSVQYTAWTYRKKGSPERTDEQWTQYFYQLHGMHPRPKPDGTKGSYSQPQHYLNEHPGDYRCVVTGGGAVLKELFFTVGEDGEIVKPACQLASINTLHTVTLLAAKDHKLSTVPYNEAIGKKRGFQGRVAWQQGCPPTKSHAD